MGAILRELLVLRSNQLLMMAKSGRSLPTARARVPIVSSGLLRGVSLQPSICLLFVRMFFASLAVNADEIEVWSRGSFTNIQQLYNRLRNSDMLQSDANLCGALAFRVQLT